VTVALVAIVSRIKTLLLNAPRGYKTIVKETLKIVIEISRSNLKTIAIINTRAIVLIILKARAKVINLLII